MRKTILTGFITLLMGIAMAVPVALAHDGWVQTNTPIVEPGEVSYVELLFGNHSNDHASYRIEGTWNADGTDVHVNTPSGQKVNIADTLFYAGETYDGVTNNYYIGSFSSTVPGIYIISAEQDSIFAHGDVASRTLRSAKTFVAVNDYPMVSAVQNFTEFDLQVTPDRAELIPLFNPVAAKTDEEVSVQLLQRGEPLAEAEVTLIRRSTSDSERYKTNEEGIVTFTTGPADYYMLRAMPTFDEGVAGEYEQTNYEATMTFIVQNGSGVSQDAVAATASVARPAEQTNGLLQNPFLYVSILLGAGWVGMITRSAKKNR